MLLARGSHLGDCYRVDLYVVCSVAAAGSAEWVPPLHHPDASLSGQHMAFLGIFSCWVALSPPVLHPAFPFWPPGCRQLLLLLSPPIPCDRELLFALEYKELVEVQGRKRKNNNQTKQTNKNHFRHSGVPSFYFFEDQCSVPCLVFASSTHCGSIQVITVAKTVQVLTSR